MHERSLIEASELVSESAPLVLLDARSGASGARAYIDAHLRGARHADLERDLSGPADEPSRGGRHPLPRVEDFCATLGEWGVGPESRVVVYDDQGGGNAAARLWWMLRALGHRSVSVLHGGLRAALEAGHPVESGSPEFASGEGYPAEAWELPIVDADEVDAARLDPRRRVIDARAPERYRGEQEPIDPVAGHIPGARSSFWRDALDERDLFRPVPELRAELEALLGDVPPERAVVYCGSGVTACHLLLRLEVCGLSGAALYVGSWSEWCRSERPREPA